jgi:acetyl esterase
VQSTGMTISLPTVRDLDAETVVEAIRATSQPPMSERGVEGARAYLEERAAAAPPGPPLSRVSDELVDEGGVSVRVRVYRPDAPPGLPLVVYFHGGGWVVGSLDASDGFCRRLAAAAECVVVSVDYPLAPEYPFPAAVECAVRAVEWSAEHADSWEADATRLAVLGDSAGGNIATVAVGRLARAGKDLVRRQILAYPGVTADRGASGSPFGTEWPLTDADRVWFIDQYAPGERTRVDPDVAPLLSDVADMPRTTLLLAGCDPLLSEGLAYAEHLWTAGVSVDLHLYSGQIHGFLTFDETILPSSGEAVGVVANAIRNT